MFEHKAKIAAGFTQMSNVDRLVYFEEYRYVLDAIAREKQIKNWRREKKLALIEKFNPMWRDMTPGD